jgi:pterin-4a-carbinolamine dehydratase
MKALITIPLIILLTFSGISVKFATHFCGGYVAATKVSLTGELATCGMERHSHSIPFQDILTNYCCEDITSAYSICNNYTPSSFFIDEVAQQVHSMIFAPDVPLSFYETVITSTDTTIRPPGLNNPDSPLRSALCIFRI